MSNLEIEKFNPSLAELQKLVQKTKEVKLDDFKDIKQLAIVHENRIELKNARVAITKQGKDLRQEAIDFQKKVIGREKELLAMIEPEEIRLQELEEQALEKLEQEKRVALLPERREKLATIGDDIKTSDETLIQLDEKAFETYYNSRIAAFNEYQRQLIEEQKRKLEEERLKLEREKELKVVEEKTREEERKKAKLEKERLEKEATERIIKLEQESKERILKQEQEAKDKLKREEEERQVENKRIEQEKFEEQKRIREEKERLEKEEKFQQFLKVNGYNEQTKGEYIIENYPDVTYLFKKIATFKHENI